MVIGNKRENVASAEPATKRRWKTMSDTPKAETELRTAYKNLIDEVGEDRAFQILDDLRSEASSAMYSDEEFTVGDVAPEPEPEEDDHEFDVDERRYVEEHNGVKVVDGDNARQDVHGEVELTAIEDGWLVLDGDTYDAKGHIKAVDYQHYEFDGDRKVWLVDEDVIEELHKHLNGGGFLFVDAREEPAQECVECGEPIPEGMFDRCSNCPSPEERLREFIDSVSEGDRIRVEYEQKNGEAMNDKEGVVRETRLPEEEEFSDVPALRFERDDGQRMYVRPDDSYESTLALYTAMSHAPFVGDVEDLIAVEDE